MRLFVTLAWLLWAGPIGASQDCSRCHPTQFKDWTASDHAKSMQVPSATTVLGDFTQSLTAPWGESFAFYRRDTVFGVTITSGDSAFDYPLAYTFGHFPLQQYLVETGSGKMQVLPYAWDSRSSEQGGQRWYLVFDEITSKNDRFHWRQPLQNWNGMCADCHSRGLSRRYSQNQDTFDTEWQAVNVDCQSCHQISDDHRYRPKIHNKMSNRHWQRGPDQSVAQLVGDKAKTATMDTCYACHSLRSPLTDGFGPEDKFLDSFSPQWLLPPLYHVDGQIKEEVYVYGSFMQSKMFRAGVTCIDCHNPHSGKVKLPNNQLCMQCHSAEVYDTTAHHHHTVDGAGGQCVNCHMPETTYMQVDGRRDHSFTVPSLSLSRQFDTPLACDNCHQAEGKEWVDKHFTWSSTPQINKARYATWLSSYGQGQSSEALKTLLTDPDLDDMKRATVIVSYGLSGQEVKPDLVVPFLKHDNPLLRKAAIEALSASASTSADMLLPVLEDDVAAVRLAAAQALAGKALPESAKPAFDGAFAQLLKGMVQQAWRGEGRVNLATVYQQTGQVQQAIGQLQSALFIDPYFDIAHVNLADLYRLQQREDLVKQTLQKGIEANPDSGVLYYSLGLHHIRQKNPKAALQALQRAYHLAPDNWQFAYAYLSMLDSLGMEPEKRELIRYLQGDQNRR